MYANVYFKTTIIKQNIKIILLQNNIHVRGPLRECHSIRSGASGLPYYCAPLVCVSDVTVMELLVVWRYNKPKTKQPLWRDSPPQSWARGGHTYEWRAATPTLFDFVLTVTSSMHRRDLTPIRTPTHHPCM